jgi:hypothetical protein
MGSRIDKDFFVAATDEGAMQRTDAGRLEPSKMINQGDILPRLGVEKARKGRLGAIREFKWG